MRNIFKEKEEVKKVCLILINSKKYQYHREICNAFINNNSSCVFYYRIIDFADDLSLHNKYFDILNAVPTLILNLDGAAFVLKTESDNLSLNAVPCRIINLMFQNPENYGSDIKLRQNLSMFTYFSPRYIKDNEELNSVRKKYQNIPNIGLLCEYDYKASLSEDINKNADNLRKWMSNALNDIKLFL